ncbi:MAG: ATP-binding protein [Dehalococcoidia bacterium]|jgi:hypothetical protein
MLEDMEILRRAYERENDSRSRIRCWEYFTLGASLTDIKRLIEEGMVIISQKTSVVTRYQLSDKGKNFVFSTMMEREFEKVPAATILEAMSLIVGFDDLKQAIAGAIEHRRRVHFLMSGPPACGKSLILEAVRATVPDAYIAFGSRTSAAGLSDALFENRPSVLLLDEVDKVERDCYAVLLGVMEGGEVLETKSKKTRGIKLDTMVLAACNSYDKMPREFLSRFALHAEFPEYTRDEFIEVCIGFLTRVEGCPSEIAEYLGRMIFDYGIGDVRKARGAWKLMNAASQEEAARAVELMYKYTPKAIHRKKAKEGARLI